MKKINLFLLFLLLTISLFSAIINIPADQPTIQAGINVTTNGDTVLIQPGTYYENINYNGKNITVGSLFLTTQDTTFISQTVIDGYYNSHVVEFSSGESNDAILTGLTIRNGSSVHGGGIYIINSSNPTLTYSIIESNTATWDGGGIY